jgi:hypothetical protein
MSGIPLGSDRRIIMTCIVQGFKTKKELKERCQAINEGMQGRDFYIQDPSIFSGNQSCMVQALPDGAEVVVTNHPKRSWFAQLGRKAGKLYVK